MARLGDICKISSSTDTINSDKVWLLNLDMVEQQTGRVIDYLFVKKNELNNSIVQFNADNVLYSKLRPNLNKVVIPNCSGFATSEMLPLKPNTSKLTKEYLTAFLRSDAFVTWASSKTAGAKMPRLSTKELLNKEIPLPPLSEQQHIAAVLDKVSELIDLRKRQLKKLDELVKSRFVEMFGDCANMVSMNDLCSIITDGTHQPPKFQDSGIPFIFVSNLANNTITYNADKYISEDTYSELYKRTPIEIGDLLLSTVGSYGHPAVVVEDRKFLFQRHIAYLKPKHDVVNSFYLHSALLAPDGQRQIEEKVKGIAQKTLNLSEIRKIMVPLPSIEKQNEFEQFVKQVDKSKFTVQQSLDKLEILKKSLMQEYFG